MKKSFFAISHIHRSTYQNKCGGTLEQLMLYNTPESLFEHLPRQVPESNLVITASARLDNRDELFSILNIPTVERPQMPDSELILRAYEKWGEACPDRLLGDWSFAIWNPSQRRLFVARDHHGNTSLYYYANNQFFAFASSVKALLALPEARLSLYKAPSLNVLDEVLFAGWFI